ncbi:MAG: DNA polymerase I [Melioribacteraceae bacterium]|nr:MAG: DNA polymerase I [Melioribacteraceae bacterium]
MTDSRKKFVLVDAMALAYKAYFAFITRPLSNSKGEPTSAVYGFTAQLIKILEDTRPDYVAVAFDPKGKTFRHERYEGYKASREKMPDDMVPQIARIREVVETLGIPLYLQDKYEADDLIGTACRFAEENGLLAIAVTPDKDYIQLVTENTYMIRPGKSTDEIIEISPAKVREEYGFEPKYMIDFLALVGDSSDDIPGVAGIGPKTAAPLIAEFGTVEDIYANIDKISKKGVVTKLEANKNNAFLSKELATIVTDVDFPIDLELAKFVKPDFDAVAKLFTDLEFKSFPEKIYKLFSDEVPQVMAEKFDEDDKDSFNTDNVSYTLITTEKDAKKLADKLSKSDLFVFDTETDSLDIFNVNLAGCAFAVKPGEAWFVATNPFTERTGDLFERNLDDRLSVEMFVEIFKPVFENGDIKKVCQNCKYDYAVLKTYGIITQNLYFDTMLASYVIDPDEKHGMDELAKRFLNYTPISIKEIIGEKKKPELIFEADMNKLSDYSCEDADITFRLYEKLSKIIDDQNLRKVAYDIEFPLVEPIEAMEREGVKLDTESLAVQSKELEILLLNYTNKIHEIAGNEFNINSTQQLQKVLFEEIGLKPTKKTKTGYSTDARALENLKGEHEIIDLLLDYRQYAKLKSTYVDSLPKLINTKTGRIHTTFNQTVASTGRLSSIDPNLQNIPIRTESGRRIREAFIARDKDHLIFSADYSQIELRIMASICGDEGLTEAFKSGEDIHKSTASKVFQVSPDEVTSDMRRKAKEVNFGILYGIGPFGLKNRLGITQKHAKEVIDTYFDTFKRVKQFMDDSVEQAKEKGYAETLTGRRRYLKNINSSNRVVRQFEERVAINMPIQGTAADMIKLAMINVHSEFETAKFKSRMILQVHDELVFDAHKDELDIIQSLVVDLMENALPLNVPVKVEYGTGLNWLEAH